MAALPRRGLPRTGELLAARLRDFLAQVESQTSELTKRETSVEEAIAGLREVEARITREREAQTQATATLNSVQSEFYKQGADISRLEQSIKYAEQRREQLNADLQEAFKGAEDARAHLQNDEQSFRQIGERIQASEPERSQSEAAEKTAHERLDEIEQAMQSWQEQWDTFNSASASADNERRMAETRLEHIESESETARERLVGLREALAGVAPAAEEQQVAVLGEQLQAARNEERERIAAVEQRRQREQALEETLRNVQQEIDETQSRARELAARMAALEAMQRSASGPDPDAVEHFLKDKQLQAAARLAQQVRVDTGWERAVEAATRIPLDALCVDDSVLDALAPQAPAGSPALIRGQRAVPDSRWVPEAGKALREYLSADCALADLLDGVYAAASVEEAMQFSNRLKAGEIIACRDGALLGNGWIRPATTAPDSASLLERENELRELVEQAARLESQLQERQDLREKSREELATLRASDGETQAMRECAERVSRLRADLAAREARLESARDRERSLQGEIQLLNEQCENATSTIDGLRKTLREADEAVSEREASRAQLAQQREELQTQLQSARENWRTARDRIHDVNLRLESMRSQTSALDRALERNRAMLLRTRTRVEELQSEIDSSEQPLTQMRAELEASLKARLEVESNLSGARTRLQEIDAALRTAEQGRSTADQNLQSRREALEEIRVELKGLQVRAQDVEQQLRDRDFEPAAVLENLSAELSEAECLRAVEAVERKISRLGPINLAAIDEFAELNERKTYLDNQHSDLTEALTTLEEAIRKIDRETRTRFKETYDKVNTGLQKLFPTLFGGGHAYLELTGEDLLETGVTVMARPPGKRNSTIHLLSGGEKALTAIALIFSIFELNPAPFCLLDEVDAPLDDANVNRYCEMVRNMATQVQFLFISHNKITMEIAERLIGVTMQEPGVSRLVAVDMEEAVEMAMSA